MSTTNVSALTSTSTINTIKATNPQTFGDQALKAGVATVTSALVSPLTSLYKQKADLIAEGIQLDIKHELKIKDLDKKHKLPADNPAKLSDDEYLVATANEEINYAAEKKILQDKKDKNQKDIDTFLKDPFAKQKAEAKKRKEARQKAKVKNKADKRKALKNKTKAIVKSLVPILSLTLTNAVAGVIANNDNIKKLVDDTNAIITSANISNDPTQLQNATLVRNNAITIINDNESRVNQIQAQIEQISVYVSIFSIIVSILSSLPIPTSVPPGVGLPLSLITKIVQIIEKANKIVLGLTALLPTILLSLEKAISILEDYKSQLLQINGEIETAAANSPNSQQTLGISGFGGLGEYKGFKLTLKEENNPKFVVKGNKRHYATATNKSGVEVVKSDYSFTQDPNDLVEQLKLVIDQQKLQA